MATLKGKFSKSDRTVQAASNSLVAAGHMSRAAVPGKGCRYNVHPAQPSGLQGYSTALGPAGARSGTIGAGLLEATFDSHLEEQPVAFEARGDLVMDDGAIGVCIGSDALFVGQKDGIE